MSAETAINNAADQVASLPGVAQSNSAFNAEQARLQREWTEQQSAKAMQFNAMEAAKNRDWQKMMSNTAHQREVADLKAAGLNPVLSAMNGNGAAVTSGATASGVVGSGSKADADTSTSAAVANLLGSILASETAIQNANLNARTEEAVADKYNAMSEIVANINARAGIDQANIHAGATRYAADQSAAASRYGADQSAAASRYSADKSNEASKYSANKHKQSVIYSSNQANSAAKYAADKGFSASVFSSGARAATDIFDTASELVPVLVSKGGKQVGFKG